MADAGAVSWRVSPANARPWTQLLNLQQAAVRLPPPPAGSLLGSCTDRDAIPTADNPCSLPGRTGRATQRYGPQQSRPPTA